MLGVSVARLNRPPRHSPRSCGVCPENPLSAFATPRPILMQLPPSRIFDARYEPEPRRNPYHDPYSPQSAACPFSFSRGSRVRRVPIRPVCGATGQQPLESRRRHVGTCDAIRRPPDTSTRITRPSRGLPVRGGGTRDRRLPSSSADLTHHVSRVRWTRLAAVRFAFVRLAGRTSDSVRAERTRKRVDTSP